MNPKPPALQREEWDFTKVPNSELAGCCWWEYARDSAFIRDTLHGYREWFLAGATGGETGDALCKRMSRIQSIGDVSNTFVRGCSYRRGIVWQSWLPDRENFRHPDAPPITGSFPDPWQTLSAGERSHRACLANYGEGLVPRPMERGDYLEAEDIGKHCRAKWERVLSAFHKIQDENPGKSEGQLREEGKLGPYEEIPPSLFLESGREITVLRIAWANYTNDELVRAFRKWVKEHRPKEIPVPSNKGRKPGDVRAHLTRLAVMRLLSRYKTSEVLNPKADGLKAILGSAQFSGSKWLDSTKWHDARREAGRFFHGLFPFLPADDKPLSWERLPPNK